jgi:phosphate transport system substrate-binding protein
MKSLKSLLLLFVMATLVVFAAACGGAEEETTNTETETGTETALSGEIGIDGSSTVFPILEAVSEEYAAVQPDVKAPVGVSGTGGGFKRFVVGETDLSNASRPIKEEEKAAAAENGIEVVELPLAFDGLSVVVNKENDWAKDLTIDDLKKMWVEGSEIKNWSDIRPEWPNEPIKLYSPGTDSGTYDYWNEVILEDVPMRRDAQLSEDDNVLVQGVMGDKYAMGYFGYAYFIENKDNLNIVAIDGGNGPVEPSNETIESGEYAPLSRPLFTYVNKESIAEKEYVYDFLKFTLENAGDLAEEVGYVRLPQEKYDAALDSLNEAAGK